MAITYDQEAAQKKLRTQKFDGIVKGFATATYKFKQAVSIASTKAWKNFYYREDPDVLTGATSTALTGTPGKGIPRGAAFPQASVSFQRVQSVIEKYGFEDTIPWEDIISDDVDVRDRTLFRISEKVAKDVDDEIWQVLTEEFTTLGAVSNIQTVTITNAQHWNNASAAIIDNLLEAKQLISEKNYPTNNLMCFISPKDHRSIMTWLTDKGAQFPTIGASVATNGNQGKLAGIGLVVSNSVEASYALVVVPKRCGTWQSMTPLTTVTIEDPLKEVTIRSAELGVTQLTDPEAVVLIIGTQKP